MCSATCGEGWQSRTRFCVSSSYSTQCSGPLREQRPCNNSAVCPGKPPTQSSTAPIQLLARPSLEPYPTNPRPCNFLPSALPWVPCHLCSVLWQAESFRPYSRDFLCRHLGKYNQKRKSFFSKNLCLFVSHKSAVLIPVNGAWDEWSPWSLCSSTCGRGFRSRTRTCTPPQFGGEPCVGPEKQTKFCNIAVCPGMDNRAHSWTTCCSPVTHTCKRADSVCLSVRLPLPPSLTLGTNASGWRVERVVQLELVFCVLC